MAIPRARPSTIREIVRALEPYKVPIQTLPSLPDLIDGQVTVNQIRTLAVEDLLERVPVGLDVQPVRHLIAGKRVLVTGAGGSIGSELAGRSPRSDRPPSSCWSATRTVCIR